MGGWFSGRVSTTWDPSADPRNSRGDTFPAFYRSTDAQHHIAQRLKQHIAQRLQHHIAQMCSIALHKRIGPHCTNAQHHIARQCTARKHSTALQRALSCPDFVLPRYNALAPRHGRTNIGVKTSPTYVVTRFLSGGITILIIKL